MPGYSENLDVFTDKPSVMERECGDGVLNINKPMGWTSHDVVAKIRGLLRGPKIGHAGTLDPAAIGVLPVLIGRGTRIAEYLLDWDKEYAAVLRLGETTDTQDATGAVLATRSTEDLTKFDIQAAVDRFRGPLTQVPPMYSAVKVGGEPLYKAARAGRTVEREARQVMIHRLEVTAIAGRDVSLRVVCSKGTYVRTLCADIGSMLGVGGHLLALERRRVGPLTMASALTLESLSHEWENGRLECSLMPLDQALSHLPSLVVDDFAAARVVHGMAVPWSAVDWGLCTDRRDLTEGTAVRLKDRAGRLLAIGRIPAGTDQSSPVARARLSAQSFSIVKMLAHV